jgi:transcriptional regulator with XRE-family HTH domain
MKRPRVAKVRATGKKYSLAVTWEDGRETEISLAGPITGLRVFAPLREGVWFERVQVADFGWAIRWMDGLDFSADSLWRLAEEQAGQAMSAEQFGKWRKKHRLTLDGASDLLGLSRRMVAYYEKGEKPIPKPVWLACRAIDAEAKLDKIQQEQATKSALTAKTPETGTIRSRAPDGTNAPPRGPTETAKTGPIRSRAKRRVA